MRHRYAAIGSRTGQTIRQFRARVEPGKAVEDLVREEMGWPRVVITSERTDGTFLYRYTASGEFAGDTWHESVEDARHQAAVEYGTALGEWFEVPAEVPESGVQEFALSAVGDAFFRGKQLGCGVHSCLQSVGWIDTRCLWSWLP